MSRKVILYIATSLDGFIARKNGDIDWLNEMNTCTEDGDYGYSEFYKSIDTVIIGRKTYDQILTFGEFPYPDKKCFVFSRKKHKDTEFVTFVKKDIVEFLKSIKKKKGKKIWLVGGAKLIEDCMKENIIDTYEICIIPVLLGEGISLFSKNFNQINIKLKDLKKFKSGAVMLTYEKKK